MVWSQYPGSQNAATLDAPRAGFSLLRSAFGRGRSCGRRLY
ncbi:unnamed protein product, partial [Ixodes hexagonus]